MKPLRSLAHPEWPYTGTAHEWRGFDEVVETITEEDLLRELEHLSGLDAEHN